MGYARWMEYLMICALGFAVGMIPGIAKVESMRHEIVSVQDATKKEIAETQAEIAAVSAELTKEKAWHADCQSVVVGDGTKTLLMDANHPYGKLVPPGVTLPPNYVPGPVWIINRRITPRTVDGTLNGVYAYQRPDGSVEGWYYTGGIKQ